MRTRTSMVFYLGVCFSLPAWAQNAYHPTNDGNPTCNRLRDLSNELFRQQRRVRDRLGAFGDQCANDALEVRRELRQKLQDFVYNTNLHTNCQTRWSELNPATAFREVGTITKYIEMCNQRPRLADKKQENLRGAPPRAREQHSSNGVPDPNKSKTPLPGTFSESANLSDCQNHFKCRTELVACDAYREEHPVLGKCAYKNLVCNNTGRRIIEINVCTIGGGCHWKDLRQGFDIGMYQLDRYSIKFDIDYLKYSECRPTK